MGQKSIENPVFGSKESQNKGLCRPPNDLGGKQALKDMSYTVESSRTDQLRSSSQKQLDITQEVFQ
jgi:hypothetical protein